MENTIKDKAIWFIIGVAISAVIGTITTITWLEGLIDRRIENDRKNNPIQIAAPEFDPNPVETILPGQITFGTWREPVQCTPGYYVCGAKQRTEDKQGNGDDTGMNGLSLLCCQF